MGSSYLFECPECGYSAEVSGGRDRGFVAVTETRTCDRCREVVDVLVGETSSLAEEGRAAFPEGEGLERYKGRCPICDKVLNNAWDGKCPRCGGEMIRNEDVIIMWD